MTSVDDLAGFELRLALRGRALVVTAVLFAVVAALVAGLGMVTFRQLGLRAVTPSALALLDLVLLVPTLVAVIAGAAALSSPGDRQLRAMLQARGVRPWAIALAKLLAATVAPLTVVLAGIGSAAIVLAGTLTAADLAALVFILIAAVLCCASLAGAGVVLGALAHRGGALMSALALWAVLALGVDLALLALAPMISGGATPLLMAAALDPIEAARLVGLLALGADAQVLGPTGMLMRTSAGPQAAIVALLAAEVAWVAAVAALAVWAVGRRDA